MRSTVVHYPFGEDRRGLCPHKLFRAGLVNQPLATSLVLFDPFGAGCCVVPVYPGVRFAHTPAKHGWPPSGPAWPRGGCDGGGAGEEPGVGATLAVARIPCVARGGPYVFGRGQAPPLRWMGSRLLPCSAGDGRSLMTPDLG